VVVRVPYDRGDDPELPKRWRAMVGMANTCSLPIFPTFSGCMHVFRSNVTQGSPILAKVRGRLCMYVSAGQARHTRDRCVVHINR